MNQPPPLVPQRLAIDVADAALAEQVAAVLDKLDAVGRTDAVAQAARIGVIHL